MLRRQDQHRVQEVFQNRLGKDDDNLKNVTLSPVAIEKFWLATNNELYSQGLPSDVLVR
jgi:hypothetical protein